MKYQCPTWKNDLNLNSLEARRDVLDAVPLQVCSKYDRFFISFGKCELCHWRTRSLELFEKRHHSSSLESNSRFERIQRMSNRISSHLDFSPVHLASLKHVLCTLCCSWSVHLVNGLSCFWYLTCSRRHVPP
ncbi:hypothetical protein J6590_036737 [Homalodisca vitripennis]|nr:hypothetical protein J6590_036737 [Homalodisca vitripennis]